MCGLICIYSPTATRFEPALLRMMTGALSHRGPDDHGFAVIGADFAKFWQHEDPMPPVVSGVAMGHQRLSILDLSDAGRQPFCSPDERYWMVYNGEIYNYREVRQELTSLGHTFRTSTDTEVVLAAYAQWGSNCLKRFNGMWALVIWDNLSRKLFASRDRFGIKPLFYSRIGDRWVFSSEIKPLLLHPAHRIRPAMRALFGFLWTEESPENGGTYFEEVKSVPAGHLLEIQDGRPQFGRYWQIPSYVDRQPRSFDQKACELRDLIHDAVRLELRADVPVGTMLSGGLDSTTIAATINSLLKEGAVESRSLGERQRAISACYPGSWNDETAKVDELAGQLNIGVDKVYPLNTDVSTRFPCVIEAVEEPFGGTMPIVQDLMMQRARSMGLRVTLNGHGPDEMLAGYPSRHCSYVAANYLAKGSLRDCLMEMTAMKRVHGVGALDFLYSLAKMQAPSLAKAARAAAVRKHGVLMRADAMKAYAGVPSRFLDMSGDGGTPLDRRLRREFFAEIVPRYLTYEDRVSMASSIESRVPFLDHRIVEFAFGLDDSDKIRNGVTKRVLRAAMKDQLPTSIVDANLKVYIEGPYMQWMRGCMRDLVESMLCSSTPAVAALTNPHEVRQLVRRVIDHGTSSPWEQGFVWRLFTAEAWLQRFSS